MPTNMHLMVYEQYKFHLLSPAMAKPLLGDIEMLGVRPSQSLLAR